MAGLSMIEIGYCAGDFGRAWTADGAVIVECDPIVGDRLLQMPRGRMYIAEKRSVTRQADLGAVVVFGCLSIEVVDRLFGVRPCLTVLVQFVKGAGSLQQENREGAGAFRWGDLGVIGIAGDCL